MNHISSYAITNIGTSMPSMVQKHTPIIVYPTDNFHQGYRVLFNNNNLGEL